MFLLEYPDNSKAKLIAHVKFILSFVQKRISGKDLVKHFSLNST